MRSQVPCRRPHIGQSTPYHRPCDLGLADRLQPALTASASYHTLIQAPHQVDRPRDILTPINEVVQEDQRTVVPLLKVFRVGRSGASIDQVVLAGQQWR